MIYICIAFFCWMSKRYQIPTYIVFDDSGYTTKKTTTTTWNRRLFTKRSFWLYQMCKRECIKRTHNSLLYWPYHKFPLKIHENIEIKTKSKYEQEWWRKKNIATIIINIIFIAQQTQINRIWLTSFHFHPK